MRELEPDEVEAALAREAHRHDYTHGLICRNCGLCGRDTCCPDTPDRCAGVPAFTPLVPRATVAVDLDDLAVRSRLSWQELLALNLGRSTWSQHFGAYVAPISTPNNQESN